MLYIHLGTSVNLQPMWSGTHLWGGLSCQNLPNQGVIIQANLPLVLPGSQKIMTLAFHLWIEHCLVPDRSTTAMMDWVLPTWNGLMALTTGHGRGPQLHITFHPHWMKLWLKQSCRRW